MAVALLVCVGLAAAVYVLYDWTAYPQTPEWYLREALRRAKQFDSGNGEDRDKIARGMFYQSIAEAYVCLGREDEARDIAKYFEKKKDADRFHKVLDKLLSKTVRERLSSQGSGLGRNPGYCAKILAINHQFDAALRFAKHAKSTFRPSAYATIAMEQHRCGLSDDADKTIAMVHFDRDKTKIRQAIRAIEAGEEFAPLWPTGRPRMQADEKLAVMHAILARLGRAHHNVFPLSGRNNSHVMGEQLGLCLAAIHDGTHSDREVQEYELQLSDIGVTPSTARVFNGKYGDTWHNIGWILALCGQIDRAVAYLKQGDPNCVADGLLCLARTGTDKDLIRMWKALDPQPEPRGSRYRDNEPRSKLGFMAMIQARRGLVGFQRYIIENGSMPEGINIGILIRTAKGLAWRQVWDKDDITPP